MGSKPDAWLSRGKGALAAHKALFETREGCLAATMNSPNYEAIPLFAIDEETREALNDAITRLEELASEDRFTLKLCAEYPLKYTYSAEQQDSFRCEIQRYEKHITALSRLAGKE